MVRLRRRDETASLYVRQVYEQPVKSISAAVVVAPGVTLSDAGGVLVSMLTVTEAGEHIAALVVGLDASASTL